MSRVRPISLIRRADRTAKFALIASFVTCFGLGSAAAQTMPDDIVVTGRGLASTPDDRADAVVTIDRERLIASASDRLEDVLSDVAGLQSFRRSDSRSANPTSQGLTLRGIGGNAASRALLVLDGVPQADPFGGWIAFPAYATTRLGAVRVLRGGGGALWGPGALTGVVELTSATPDQLAPLAANVAGGSLNAIEGTATATLVRPGGFATITAGYARGDGFAPIVVADRGPVDRRAPYRQANVAVRGVIAADGATEIQATVQAFTDRRDRGTDFSAIESDGADASIRLVGSGRWRWSALGYVQTRRFASGFTSVDANRTTVTPTLDQYNVPATGLGARFDVVPPLGERITLRIGGDVRDTSGRTQELFTYVAGAPTRRREAGGITRTAGGFVDLQTIFGALKVDANARIDGWWIEDGRLFEAMLGTGAALTNTGFADRSGSEPTGRLGAAFEAGRGVSLRMAGYRSWRLPTPNELYRPFRVGADATAANPALAPERLEGVEAGIDFRPDAATHLSATLYTNRVRDAVSNLTIARGPGNFPGVGFVSAAGSFRRRENLDAIEAIGVEVEGGATLGAVSATLSYAYTDARVVGSVLAAALDGLRPAQTPSHQASATIGYSAAAMRGAVTARYVADQFEDDQNVRVLGGAFTLDATASVSVRAGVAVEARVENAFDTFVATGFSGVARERARPRQLWLGLRFGG